MNTERQDLHEPIALPDEFTDKVYCQAHVMAALDCDEQTFWGLYTTGKIPRGYSLMRLTGVPLIVWPKRILDDWNNNGRPAEPGSLELENEVLHLLMDACESQGIVFPTCDPVIGPELN